MGDFVRNETRCFKCLVAHSSRATNAPTTTTACSSKPPADADAVAAAGKTTPTTPTAATAAAAAAAAGGGGGGGGGPVKRKAGAVDDSVASASIFASASASASAAVAATKQPACLWQLVDTPAVAAEAVAALQAKRASDGLPPELSHVTRRRLLAELRRIQKDAHPSCDVYPTESNLAFWKVRRVRVGWLVEEGEEGCLGW